MNDTHNTHTSYTNYQKFKIVLLGDQSVGKSSILSRFVSDSFQENHNSTIGVDFIVKTIVCDDKTYKIHFWDTAGQERFHSLIPSYIKNCQVAILVYDVNKRKSFENLSRWQESVLEEKGDEIMLGIMGNKTDLEQREVSTEEGLRYAQGINALFLEGSAKNGQKVNEFLRLVCKTLIDNETEQNRVKDEKSNDSFEKLTKRDLEIEENKRKKCC